MPKPPRSAAGRKPPEPSKNHAEVDEWMQGVMPRLHPLVKYLDGLIRETVPGLQYAIKWRKAHYGLPKIGWIIEVVSYDISVNIVFYAGATFDPPPPLGTTGSARYIKLTSLEEAQDPEIRTWIKQAGRVAGWR